MAILTTDQSSQSCDGMQSEFRGLSMPLTEQMHSESVRLEQTAIDTLERHPHFRGRTQSIRCNCIGPKLRIDGMLPSFYLKQLAQELLRDVQGIDNIDNRILVVSPRGIIETEDGTCSSAKPR